MVANTPLRFQAKIKRRAVEFQMGRVRASKHGSHKCVEDNGKKANNTSFFKTLLKTCSNLRNNRLRKTVRSLDRNSEPQWERWCFNLC